LVLCCVLSGITN